jgi:hypothetical protein
VNSEQKSAKPLRDFLGQEILEGDFLVYATTEDNRSELPALDILKVTRIQAGGHIIQTFDVVVIKNSARNPSRPVGALVRIVAYREVDGEPYWPSQFFIKIPRPEGL